MDLTLKKAADALMDILPDWTASIAASMINRVYNKNKRLQVGNERVSQHSEIKNAFALKSADPH